jgi:hypothetical protein
MVGLTNDGLERNWKKIVVAYHATISPFAQSDSGKIQKPVRIAGVLAKIQTWHLLNTILRVLLLYQPIRCFHLVLHNFHLKKISTKCKKSQSLRHLLNITREATVFITWYITLGNQGVYQDASLKVGYYILFKV